MSSRVLAVAAVALGVSTVLLAAVLVGGTIGLVVATLAGSAVAVGAVRARLGSEPRPPRAQRWPVQPFHDYRRLEFLLTWGYGQRSNPAATRILTRHARAVLAERHGIDLDRDPDAARRLLGERAWTVLHPPHESPVDIPHLVDRLEEL